MNITPINPTVAILTSVLSAFILAVYIISYCFRYGIPSSISSSYYRIKHHILFMLTMWISAALILPGDILLSRPSTQWLLFVAIAGMFLVGAAPRFEDVHQKFIHYLGGALSAAGSIFWVLFNAPQALVLWSLLVVYGIYLLLSRKKLSKANPIFVLEVITIMTLYTALFLKFIQL